MILKNPVRKTRRVLKEIFKESSLSEGSPQKQAKVRRIFFWNNQISKTLWVWILSKMNLNLTTQVLLKSDKVLEIFITNNFILKIMSMRWNQRDLVNYKFKTNQTFKINKRFRANNKINNWCIKQILINKNKSKFNQHLLSKEKTLRKNHWLSLRC